MNSQRIEDTAGSNRIADPKVIFKVLNAQFASPNVHYVYIG